MVSIRRFGYRGRILGNGFTETNDRRKKSGNEEKLQIISSGHLKGEPYCWNKCILANSMGPLSTRMTPLSTQVKMCIESANTKAANFCDEYIYDNLSGTVNGLSDEERSENAVGFTNPQLQEDSTSESDAEINATKIYDVLKNNEEKCVRMKVASQERSDKSVYAHQGHQQRTVQPTSRNVRREIVTSFSQTLEDCERAGDLVLKTHTSSRFLHLSTTSSKFVAREQMGAIWQPNKRPNSCDEYVYDHLSGIGIKQSAKEKNDDSLSIESDEGSSASDLEISQQNAELKTEVFTDEQDQQQSGQNLNQNSGCAVADVDEFLISARNSNCKHSCKKVCTFSQAEICKNATSYQRKNPTEESMCRRFAKREHSTILGSSDEYIYDHLSATSNMHSDEEKDLWGSQSMRSEEDSNELDTDICATSKERKLKLSCAEMEEKQTLDPKSPAANMNNIDVNAGELGSTQAKKNKVNFEATGSGRNNSILFWLIEAEVVKENAEVQYVRKKDRKVMKDGKLTSKGVLCACCDQLFTLSRFEFHAGSKLHRPAANMFLADGRSLVECQNQASQLLNVQ